MALNLRCLKELITVQNDWEINHEYSTLEKRYHMTDVSTRFIIIWTQITAI